jgi:hypothetical protein
MRAITMASLTMGAAVGAGLIIGTISAGPDNRPRPTGLAAQPAAVVKMPSDERDFIEATIRARDLYNKGENEMAKGAARAERKRWVCDALRSYIVSSWTGTVTTLSSNGDGKGVLGVQLAQRVSVKTWNNSLSDIGDSTLIGPSSSLFKAAMRMKNGDRVRFSGEFIKSGTDCVRESSMTLAGSMTDPEFIFRFEDIELAGAVK